MAFQRGEETDDGLLGALMHAEFQATVLDFIAAYVKANSATAKK